MYRRAILVVSGVLALMLLLSGCGGLLDLFLDSSEPSTDGSDPTPVRNLDDDFAFTSGNWVYSSRDTDNSTFLSPAFDNTARVSIGSTGVSVNGHDVYTGSFRGSTYLFSDAIITPDEFGVLDFVWQADIPASTYGAYVVGLLAPVDNTDMNAGTIAGIRPDYLSTNNSFNGSTVIPPNTDIYTRIENLGGGSFAVSAATGGFAGEAGATTVNERTLTNVPSADYRLYLAYGDTYDENAGVLLKSLHFE